MFAPAVSAHPWCDRYGASRIGADLATGQEQYQSQPAHAGGTGADRHWAHAGWQG